MALADELDNRYPAQFVKNISNPYTSNASAKDTARIGEAVEDVEGDFLNEGIEIDLSNKAHVRVAVRGVVALLKEMGGHPGASKAVERYEERLSKLAEATSRDRILMQSDSPLQPSTEPTNSKPWSDRDHFGDVTPRPPNSAVDEDEGQ